MRALELKVPPIIVFAVFGALMFWASKLFPAASLMPITRYTLFGLFLFFGVISGIGGIISFRLAKTTTNPMSPDKASSCVTTGVYRFSRNPMYLALLLVLIGWGLFLGSLPALIITTGFWAYMTLFQIKPEERVLETLFGNDYIAYRTKVRRWI